VDDHDLSFSWTVRSITKNGFSMFLKFTKPSKVSNYAREKHFLNMEFTDKNWIISTTSGKVLELTLKLDFKAPPQFKNIGQLGETQAVADTIENAVTFSLVLLIIG